MTLQLKGKRNVVQAAKHRLLIANKYCSRFYVSFSGGKDSIAIGSIVEQMIDEVRESYNVREVVCVKTGRRFPMRSWNYGTGEVLIDTTVGDE